MLGFDVVFAEPDDSSGLRQLQALAQNELNQGTEFVAHLRQLAPDLDFDGGMVPVSQLRGKMALVGTTAPGTVDLRVTPVAATYPGVDVQANALASLLDRRFLVRPAHANTYEAMWLLLIGVMLAFLLPFLRAAVAFTLSFGVVAALVAFNWWLYVTYGLVMRLAPIVLLTVLVSGVNVGYGYLVTTRSRRKLIALFGTYVPPELVQEMVKNPDHHTLRAKSQKLTVMFCDMRGFTRLSEQMDRCICSNCSTRYSTS